VAASKVAITALGGATQLNDRLRQPVVLVLDRVCPVALLTP
jgi:hypothetical protein